MDDRPRRPRASQALSQKQMIDGITGTQIDNLRAMAARLLLRGLSTDEIVETANDLLTAGVYDDSLLAIVDASPAVLSNIEPAFRSLLANASLQIPDAEAAVWELLKIHIGQIDRCTGDIFVPLDDFINEVYYTKPFQDKPGEFVGEHYGLKTWVGDYWIYDDLIDRGEVICYNGRSGNEVKLELIQSIKQSAKEWLAKYSRRQEQDQKSLSSNSTWA